MKDKTITVSIRLLETSQPLQFKKVFNTYQKGDLFCVYYENDKYEHVVRKIPIDHIFDIEEEYGSK